MAEVNGQPVQSTPVAASYLEIRRLWHPGDTVRLTLPMDVRFIECHPYAAENTGRVAIMRGPLLYCMEQVDNPGVELRDISISPDDQLSTAFRADLLGGVAVVRMQAQLMPLDKLWSGRLYRPASSAQEPCRGRTVEVTAIPYYAWANREPGRMLVWLPRD